jgi:pimeloyl-ACP methyl ester carboxylesterase
MADWLLARRTQAAGEEIAYEIVGDGPPVVLVHGYPGNSYGWRKIAPALAKTHRVHVYDHAGFGASGRRADQDMAAPHQARVLAALLKGWKLERPAMIAHDFGVAVALGAHLFEGADYAKMALLDAATLNPCVSANSMHVRAHLTAYQTLPAKLYEQIMRAHVPTTMHTPMDEQTFQAYFRPWSGPEGQAAYYRFLGQFDEAYLSRIEARLGEIRVPTLVIWGQDDTWIPQSHGERLAKLIPGAKLELMPEAGHFIMDDAPEAVAGLLGQFLT